MGSDVQANSTNSELYQPKFRSDWDNYILYDLADWVNGMAFRNIQFSPSGKPVIKIAEIKNGISGQTKFTEDDYDLAYLISDGDMLFSWSGQPETSIDVFRWRGPTGWLNQHIFKVYPKKECQENYFFYLLKYLNPNFVRIARNKQTTGLGHVTKKDLQAITVRIPSDEKEQRAIAHILGSLDDKIELNRQMNRTLEKMAQAIFKSWFIDFDPVRAKADLPAGRQEAVPSARRGSFFVYAIECEGDSIYIGHTEDVQRRFDEHCSGKGAQWTKTHPPIRIAYWAELPTQKAAVAREKKLKTGAGREWLKLEIAKRDLLPTGLPKDIADLFPDSFEESELGEIPKGWAPTAISALLDINPRLTLPKGEIATYVDMKALPTSGFSVTGAIKKEYKGGVKFQQNDVLLARITPCLENGKTGLVDFLDEGEVGFGSTEFIVLRGKNKISKEFVYCLARDDQFRRNCISSMVGSSGRQRVQNACFDHYKLAIAPESILTAFTEYSRTSFEKITENSRELLMLSRLRDTLLSKLISGELPISDAEKLLEGVG